MSYSENRQLVKIIREICDEQKIKLKEYSESWIMELSKNKQTTFIFGYKFENNSATTLSICNDKVATYLLLTEHGIQSIEHNFFMRYSYTTKKDLYQQILPLLQKYKCLVIKNNTGSGGKLVYKVETKAKLKYSIKRLLTKTKSLAVSPFCDIKKEYRCIVCDGQVELIYEKVRPSVVGDGKSKVKELINKLDYSPKISKIVKQNYVPAQGEQVILNWKHNLFFGAGANTQIPTKLKNTLKKIALKTTKVLKAKFVSVDIVLVDNMYQVLEVNSGIMMEKFSTFGPDNYNKAKQIYTKAILKCLNNSTI